MKSAALLTRMVCITLAAIFFALSAEAADLTVEQIVVKSYDHGALDLETATADMNMTLIVRDKDVSEERKVRIRAMKKDGMTRTMLHFLAPEDVSGTAFLYVENKDRDDDLWLYMPSLKKALRKGGKSGKEESFLGTEFTYGDMEHREVSDYDHKRLPDEKLGPFDCYVVESIKKKVEDRIYGKNVTWIDKKDFVPRRIIFYDKTDPTKEQKVLTVEKVETVDGKLLITQSTMRNLKNHKATRLVISNIDGKAKFTDEDFTKERMTKI